MVALVCFFPLFINTAIGIVQELRAKFTLDRLSLISQPKVRVIRDGREQEEEGATHRVDPRRERGVVAG
jgi:magnesium-transporting ATPase (P-type)